MNANDEQSMKAKQLSTPRVRVEAVADSFLFEVSVHDLGIVSEDEARALAVAIEGILKGKLTVNSTGDLVLRWR